MTTILERPPATSLAERIPAWGVSVDLTPSEITRGRQTKVVQRLMVLGLVVVLLACGGLSLLAFGDRSTAQDSYDRSQQQTQALQAAAHDYDDLVTATQIQQQTEDTAAGLMSQDVDFVNLIAKIRFELPAGVLIDNIAVLLAPGAAAAVDVPGTTTNDAGTTIGTITVSGSGTRIKALAPFVASLNHTQGITGVVPTSTTQTDTGMVYTLTMSFTDDLYTHRFDQAADQ